MLHRIISRSNVTAEQLTKSISLSAIKLTASNPCSFPQGTALPSISLVQELKKSLPWSYRENQIPCFGSMVCLGRSCPTSAPFPFPPQPGEEGCSPSGVNAAAHQVPHRQGVLEKSTYLLSFAQTHFKAQTGKNRRPPPQQ